MAAKGGDREKMDWEFGISRCKFKRDINSKFMNRSIFSGFPHSSVGKESTCKAGDTGLMPESGRCAGQGKGYPLQYSGLENSMDYGVAKSQT